MRLKSHCTGGQKFTYAGRFHDDKLLLIVGRTNIDNRSFVLEKLISTLCSSGITALWYKNKFTSVQKAIQAELKTWGQSKINRLFKKRHRTRHYLRTIIHFFLRVKYPSRWKFFFNLAPKSIPEQAHDLQNFIQKLNRKNIIILAHSAGGIISSLIADEPTIKKIICFSYPFKHPKHNEEPYRTQHLPFIKKPILIIQGRKDEYGGENVCVDYSLSSSITFLFTDNDHDYKSSSLGDYENVLQRIKDFIAD